MKKILGITLLIFSALCFGQKSDAKKNRIDPKLVGSWNGEEDDQQIAGMHKSWIMHRFDDGKFLLLFVAVENGEATTYTEKGQWWVENGKFYELHKVDGKTDVYTYEVLDNTHIKFKEDHMSIKQVSGNYEFIDTKMED